MITFEEFKERLSINENEWSFNCDDLCCSECPFSMFCLDDMIWVVMGGE